MSEKNCDLASIVDRSNILKTNFLFFVISGHGFCCSDSVFLSKAPISSYKKLVK